MIPLWQTTDWEHFQKALGHQCYRLSGVRGPLMIIHPLFLGMSYGYIPRGPVLAHPDELGPFLHQLNLIGKKHRLIFSRIDPEKPIPPFRSPETKESHSIQPETTLLLDLTASEKELLDQMKRKGRYNIQLAAKKCVTVSMAQGAEQRKKFCHIFSQLLKDTTQRDVFSAHDEHYYQTMLESLPESEIFMAWYEDKPLSGAIVVFQHERAIYYYGASSNDHRELMSPYLVQWTAILEAKRRGCTTYDFLGIAPEDAVDDHPWRGITEFKKKFGGVVVNYPKPLDIIHRPFWYTLYRIVKGFQKLFRS